MNFWFKYYNNLLTIEHQKESLTTPDMSYWFAKANIPGSDIKALQSKACEAPYYAYCFARDIVGADIKYCQEYACKDPLYAYYFAINIPGANIKYCQEHACKSSYWAYDFVLNIPGADKEYCFKHAFPEDEYGPNRWKSEYNKYVMNKACE